MALPQKCPNPACPFLFDPAQVPLGVVIACPQCGLRFQLAPPASGYPAYGPPPVASESTFQDDLFASVEEPVAKPKGPVSRGKKNPLSADEPKRIRGNYGSLKSIIVATGVVFGIAAVFIAIIVLSKLRKANLKRDETDVDIKFPDLNLKFTKPSADIGWTKHDDSRSSLNAALFGYIKGETTSPTGWIVGDAQRLDHEAREIDLSERATELLNRNFENVTEAEEKSDDTLCGLPALKFVYRATIKKTGESVIVEVIALANKAYAVWVVGWAPERGFAAVAGEMKIIRAGLQISKANDANIEMPTITRTFRSKSGIYTIKDSDGLWTEKKPATDRDITATLWLRGAPKAGGQSKISTADLVVIEVAPDGDAEQQASTLVKKSLPLGEPTIEELTGDPKGDPASSNAAPPIPVTRWKVRFRGSDQSVNRLIVFAHCESQGKLVIAYASCHLKDLPYWEQRSMAIVGSLAARAK